MDEVSPELLKALIELGIIPEEMAGLDSQIAEAQALRQSPMPEGQMAGRVFVAPNPLQYAAAGYERYKGNKELKDLREQRKTLLDKTTQGRMGYAQALMNALRGSQPQPPPIQPAGPQPQGGTTYPVQ